MCPFDGGHKSPMGYLQSFQSDSDRALQTLFVFSETPQAANGKSLVADTTPGAIWVNK